MTPKPHGVEGKTDGQAMNKSSRISPVLQGLCLHNVVGPGRRAPLSYLGTQGGVTREVAFTVGPGG